MILPDFTIVNDIKESLVKHKDRVACVFDDSQLLYSELSEKSSFAMAQLRELGVVKGDLVFVCLDNCIEVPIVYLAIMELGAVFVPVNPQWHEDRTSLMVKNIRPRLVITNGKYFAFENSNVATLSSLFVASELSGELPETTLDDPIYAFFTSGSTGLPKCALNMHKGIKNRFDFMSRLFSSFLDDLVVLQNSKLSFDSSIWQMLWPLTVGGTVVLRQTSQLTDFDHILDEISTNSVQMTDFVPTIFSEFVNYVKRDTKRIEKIQSLKALLVGGEAIRPADIWEVKKMVPGMDVYNTYGPTEASIGMMFKKVTEEDKDYIPIGHPIDNTYAVVVDENDQLVGPNVKGEIIIGGACIGGGYINDPKKTEAAYLDNPFDHIPGEKLFRTGNIGYLDENNVFHCIGRLDDEVKIGGIRISLSEIEGEVESHETIINSKVIVYEMHGSQQIACFVEAEEPVEENAIKKWLSTRILRECVPMRIIQLSSFPTNDNGKIDLVGLKEYLANQTTFKIEESGDVVLGIVEKVIGQKVEDEEQPLVDFGANSLDMYVICRQLEEYLGKSVSVKKLFCEFTVKKLRALCELSTSDSTEDFDSAYLEELLRKDMVNRALRLSQKHPFSGPAKDIFVTGGTGYLGLHLLQQLGNEYVDGDIFCLVRRPCMLDSEAFRREFERYNLTFPKNLSERLKPILGDIEKPLFGLTESEFSRLGNSLCHIFFMAGKVNLLAEYMMLRDSNVTSLEYAFQLSEINNSRLSYVSSNTINAFTNSYSCSQIVENGVAENISGYDLTKIISEKLLFDHLMNGNKVSIIRVGDIISNDLNSPLNKNSILAYLMDLIHSIKAIPNVKVTIDVVSAAILSKQLISFQGPFLSLSEKEPITQFFSSRCPDCEVVNKDEFMKRVKEANGLSRGAEFVRGIFLGTEDRTLEDIFHENFIKPFTPVNVRELTFNFMGSWFSSSGVYEEEIHAVS